MVALSPKGKGKPSRNSQDEDEDEGGSGTEADGVQALVGLAAVVRHLSGGT
jgi:hypothetical protein